MPRNVHSISPRRVLPSPKSSLPRLYPLRSRIMASQAPVPTRPIKVLMLHGFTQSGTLFYAKTRALEKNLQKAFPAGITLHYPTAPIRLSLADVPFVASNEDQASYGVDKDKDKELDVWGWWRRKGDSEPYTYEGIERGMDHIAEVLKTEGPFDGVIGFSQGGACASMLASLLEPGRREAFESFYPDGGMRYPESFEDSIGHITTAIHPPLKFAVSYSGFAARGGKLYRGFYEPKIKTPTLHFLGTLDTVVEEKRSLALVEACERSEGRVVYHPGGHFLPSSQKAYVSALIGFIREVTADVDGTKNGNADESHQVLLTRIQ